MSSVRRDEEMFCLNQYKCCAQGAHPPKFKTCTINLFVGERFKTPTNLILYGKLPINLISVTYGVSMVKMIKMKMMLNT